jgi:hypothetical protein
MSFPCFFSTTTRDRVWGFLGIAPIQGAFWRFLGSIAWAHGTIGGVLCRSPFYPGPSAAMPLRIGDALSVSYVSRNYAFAAVTFSELCGGFLQSACPMGVNCYCGLTVAVLAFMIK